MPRARERGIVTHTHRERDRHTHTEREREREIIYSVQNVFFFFVVDYPASVCAF